MLKEVKMFTIVCDNCGTDSAENADYSCWNDSDGANQAAEDAGFIKHDGKDICPDCFDYDEEENIIIKKFN